MSKGFRLMCGLVVAAVWFAGGYAQAHAQRGPKVSQGGRVLESWYTYWGLGYSVLQYPDDTQNFLDFLDDQPGVSRISLNIDALGFYWPFQTTSTALGVVLNTVGDSYSTDVDNSFTVYQGLLAASLMHSLTDIMGEGITLRGDLGLAFVSSELEQQGSMGTITKTSDTYMGVGFLLGGGYALPVSSETSLLFNANYAMRIVEGDTFGAISFSLGALF